MFQDYLNEVDPRSSHSDIGTTKKPQRQSVSVWRAPTPFSNSPPIQQVGEGTVCLPKQAMSLALHSITLETADCGHVAVMFPQR